MMKRVRAALLVSSLAIFACNRADVKKDVLPPASGTALAPPVVPKLSEIAFGTDAGAQADDSSVFRGTGTLHPLKEAQLGPKSSGVIAAIAVEQGDRVKKGQLLFRLDSRQAQLAVEQAKTAVASAKVAEQTAELEFNRTKQLFEKGNVAQAAYDQAKARLDGATAAVNQANASVALAKKVAADSAVHSPIDGVVTAKLKSVGETATMMPPTIILIVHDVSKLELRARLPERALGTLKAGDHVKVDVPALGQRLSVPIERINPSVDARTRTLEIVAVVDNAAGKLRSGMLAEVSFGEAAADAGAVAAEDAAR
jgi:RND family efflux transporter MFP subunit